MLVGMRVFMNVLVGFACALSMIVLMAVRGAVGMHMIVLMVNVFALDLHLSIAAAASGTH
jgi:hypothetical protein